MRYGTGSHLDLDVGIHLGMKQTLPQERLEQTMSCPMFGSKVEIHQMALTKP